MPATVIQTPRAAPAARLRRGLTAFFVLCVFLLTTETAHGGRVRLRVGEPPPEMTWVSVAGDSLSWHALREDRPLVMVFWATWCAVCKKDWPELKALADRYADAPLPPVWAAVSVGEEPGKVARVAAERKLPGKIIADPREANGNAMGVEFVPIVCVLDAEGKLAYIGPPKLGKLTRLLEDLTSPAKEVSE